MRILFINQCYWPDSAATAQILTDLAEELASRSHQVTIVCSRKPYAGQKGTYPKKEIHNGVKIRRIASLGLGKKAGMIGRFIDAFSYVAGTLFVSLTMKKQDAVVTLSSPPLIGVVGRINQIIRRTAHINWCMDVFPDNGVEFGVIRRNGWIHKIIAASASFYLKSADAVAVLSKYMATRIRRYGVNDENISIVPVWADGRKLKPVTNKENWFLQKYLLKDKFVVMFSGNLTYGGDIDTVIKALSELRSDRDIVFVLISEGCRFDEFRTKCEELNLENVLFLSYQKRDELSYSLSAASVHLITNKKGLEGIREPCKVYGILAAGRPFILIGDSRCAAGDIAKEHDVGIIMEEGDVPNLVRVIRNLKKSQKEWARMCQISRKIFEKQYDAIYAINSFENILFKVLKSRAATKSVPKNSGVIESAACIARGNENNRS